MECTHLGDEISGERRRRRATVLMVSRASWEKLQYTIAEGTNSNTVRVLLESRYPFLLSDLTEEQESALRGATQAATSAVVELLVCASAQGNLAWVEHLVSTCGVDCASNLNRTPIAAAAEGGHIQVIEYLLQYSDGSKLSADTCLPPLLAAVDQGHMEVLELLLNHVDSCVELDMIYRPLLYQAVCQDDFAIASLLLAHGADVNSRLEQGSSLDETLLSKAQSEVMARLLLRSGVEMFRDAVLPGHVSRSVTGYSGV